MNDFKRLVIAWLKKRLGIGSPTTYFYYGYLYEYDYRINKSKRGQSMKTLKYYYKCIKWLYKNRRWENSRQKWKALDREVKL